MFRLKIELSVRGMTGSMNDEGKIFIFNHCMEKEPIYQSEPYKWKLIVSRILLPVLVMAVCWCEYRIWILTWERAKGTFFLFLFSSVVFALLGIPLIYLVKYLVAKKPALLVYNNSIYIHDKEILFADIKRIQFNEQQFSMWSVPKELVRIILINGGLITIDVGHYRNGAMFRSVCEKIQDNISNGIFEIKDFKAPEVTINAVSPEDLRGEEFKGYFRYPVLVIFFGLMMLSAAIFLLLTPLNDATYTFNECMAVWFFGLFFLSGRALNYLLLSSKYIIVKNYMYFWRRTVFRMEDVIQFQIIDFSRSSYLQIKTRDYKVHRFVISPPLFTDVEKVVNGYIQKSSVGKTVRQ